MNEENRMQEIMNRIKNRRIELSLSYQELADKTGLSKSTLQRYETGAIRNMPLDKLEVLSKALDIDPSYLMGWKTQNTDNQKLSNNENILLNNYNKLNSTGKEKLIEYSEDLAGNIKYIDNNNVIKLNNSSTKSSIVVEEDRSHLIPKASHDKEGNFTEEDYKHDDDLMLNDDLWK
ncbi:helix-turn-helix domain-containing protein [Clostridium neonatale]|uniref:helix-turn-helix domain-containing protein n=1 Tax=Clostridium neonatale TaxID=137838 RepID=UPI00374F8FEC